LSAERGHKGLVSGLPPPFNAPILSPPTTHHPYYYTCDDITGWKKAAQNKA